MSILYPTASPRKINAFALGLYPQRDTRPPLGPRPEDSAYVAGFDLGISWEDGEPSSDLSPYCQACWQAGWDAGRREAEAERLEWCSRYDAETVELRERLIEAQEIAEECGSQVGHDEYATALASEGN